MNIKIKTTLIAASIIAMLTAAFGIIFIGRSSESYEDKLIQAGIYLESRDYDNAIAIYNKIISENRECAEAYAGLSDAYFAKNKTEKALEILEKGAERTGGDDIVIDKMSELFPDYQYADASDDNYDEDSDWDEDDDEDGLIDEFEEDTETTAETSAPETEASEPEEETTAAPQESETETETTVPMTAATTVPTTTAAPVTTTAAPVIVTTAPPAVTAPPATSQATTRVTTAQTTAATTTVTTTEALKDVSVPDLTRMTLDEAYAWCSKNNVILSVVGAESDSAEILSQSPAPDSTVKENSSIIVVLAE